MAASFHISMPRGGYASGRTLWEQASRGLSEITANFSAFCDILAIQVAPEAMVEALRPTLNLSKVYAPKDTHRMVNSGYVEIVRRRGNPRVEIGYNRHGEAPYTIFVHEMPMAHAPPTQSKFLQRAMYEDQQNIMTRAALGIKSRTGL
jgi:hypothetical protein